MQSGSFRKNELLLFLEAQRCLKLKLIKPKVLTGGGDNLNGYCLGLLFGFSLQQCILLGMAVSGAYIQNGTSPDIKEGWGGKIAGDKYPFHIVVFSIYTSRWVK